MGWEISFRSKGLNSGRKLRNNCSSISSFHAPRNEASGAPDLLDHLKRQQFRYPLMAERSGMRLKLTKGTVDLVVHNQLLPCGLDSAARPTRYHRQLQIIIWSSDVICVGSLESPKGRGCCA
jgi:hypothetical protein